jgi:hypothetical protein
MVESPLVAMRKGRAGSDVDAAETIIEANETRIRMGRSMGYWGLTEICWSTTPQGSVPLIVKRKLGGRWFRRQEGGEQFENPRTTTREEKYTDRRRGASRRCR